MSVMEAPPSTVAARPVKPLIELRGIAKRYGAVTAVKDVTLDIREGEFLTLLGPSGSGKTTLLMMLAGFVPPSSGQILIGDRDIAPLPPERRSFGMVFQGYALFPHLSVFDNVAFPLTVRREPRDAIRRKVEGALSLVDMAGFSGRMPRMLSGGQQQRVALARAIVFDPRVLLLDEPLGALDRQLRANLQDELKALHRRLGTTFICVTHDQEEALSLSDRIVVMREGGIAQTGTPADIYRRPASRFVANFLGESNILEGRSIGREGEVSIIEIGGTRLRVGGEGSPGKALVSIRPEHVGLGERPSCGEQMLSLGGRISGVTFVGTDYRVRLETDQGPLTARLRASDAMAHGLHEGAEAWALCPAGAFWRVGED